MPPMYLDSVLADIKKESAPPKALHAEHLFKLNEAVFNLNEEDTVDVAMATRLFQAVEKIRIAYNGGKFDNTDSNFFYDYLALLGTMQNQHFFSQKQTEKMLEWIGEVVNDSTRGSGESKETASSTKSLEAENERLKKRLSKLEDAEAPSGRNSKGKASASEPEKGKKGGKSNGKSAWEYDYYEEEPPTKSKGKGKGKGKVDDEPPQSSKGKGKKGNAKSFDNEESVKGKGKGKEEGKGKHGKRSSESESKGKGTEEKSAKGKGKGKDEDKGKAKSKGKSKDKSESPPPVRASKAKGKGKSGGSSKGSKKY